MASNSTAVLNYISRGLKPVLAFLAIFAIFFGIKTSDYLYSASGVALIVALVAEHRGVNKLYSIGMLAFFALLGLSFLYP